MRDRDRLFLIGGVMVAVLVVTWMFWVSPERKSAAALESQVATAQQSVATAQGQLQAAQSNKRQYAAAYTALVNVGKAVPATDEVPSLIYELDQASNARDVAFSSVTAGGGSGSSAPAAAVDSATAAAPGLSTLPFQFEFHGTFFDLYHLLGRLNNFAVQTKNGTLIVTGRLLTIQGASLTPAGTSGGTSSTSSTSSAPSAVELEGTVTADAYVLPATPATSAATPATPTAAGTTATPSTTAPAVIQPNP